MFVLDKYEILSDALPSFQHEMDIESRKHGE